MHLYYTSRIATEMPSRLDRQIHNLGCGPDAAWLQPSATTSCATATAAAVDVLHDGGNAIDAAVAAAWTLAVCEPAESGIGGQTVLLIWFHGDRATVLDGTSAAPDGVSPKTVRRRQQRRGYRACTVPTTPLTLDYAQQKYGVLARQRVIEPALRAAEEGFEVTERYRQSLKTILRYPDPEFNLRPLFFKDGRRPYHTGEVFRQPRLAATLRRLAYAGIEDFYQGYLAQEIDKDMQDHQGLITTADLATCRAPVERSALWGDYRGHPIATSLAGTGGLQLLVALGALQQFDQKLLATDVYAWRELVAAITAEVLRERDRWPDHTDNITPWFLRWQLDEARAMELAHRIGQARCEVNLVGGVEEPGNTTHLCTADAAGNVVALTQSIQSVFGAKVAHPSLGFVYNNYLCTCRRSGTAYRLAGGCQPKSNVSPTILFHPSDQAAACGNGDHYGGHATIERVKLVLGAAGSRRILSSILQVISQVFDRGSSLSSALAEPRIHGLTSGKVWVERPAATDALLRRLEKRFSHVCVKPELSREMGAVQAIMFDEEGAATAAADPRRDGIATCLPKT
jgi:gamma-glutamyltranspeptidase/glutathione hydrolase